MIGFGVRKYRHAITVGLIAALFLTFDAGKARAATNYWNLFNGEGDSTENAVYVTYGTFGDMLNDKNRQGLSITPDGGNSARNIVGSGASIVPDLPAVPLPASAWMLLTALGGLGVFGRRQHIGRCCTARNTGKVWAASVAV